jgi:hypothetical protein
MALEVIPLSFRTAPAGGEVQLHPVPPIVSRNRLVLLIHGFNNTIPEAEDAYKNFLSKQRDRAKYTAGGDFAPDRSIIKIFWKGDDWGMVSPVYYMKAIPNAVATGKALALILKTMADLHGALEVMVVAHSLGSRLTLEMMKNLSSDRRITVRRFIFFAAATATFMLEPDEQHGLRKAFDLCNPEAAVSLFSEADDVLSLTFPPGQSLASGDEGNFPTALGHEYWGALQAPPILEQKRNAGSGHSDYWGWRHKKPKCEDFANDEARKALGFTGVGDRITSESHVAGRDTAEPRELPSMETASRSVASRIVA